MSFWVCLCFRVCALFLCFYLKNPFQLGVLQLPTSCVPPLDCWTRVFLKQKKILKISAQTNSYLRCNKTELWLVHSTLEIQLFNSIQKYVLSTSSRIFPYYQGDSTIFHKGNFHKHTPNSKNLLLQVLTMRMKEHRLIL